MSRLLIDLPISMAVIDVKQGMNFHTNSGRFYLLFEYCRSDEHIELCDTEEQGSMTGGDGVDRVDDPTDG